jgi:hypothetical protein
MEQEIQEDREVHAVDNRQLSVVTAADSRRQSTASAGQIGTDEGGTLLESLFQLGLNPVRRLPIVADGNQGSRFRAANPDGCVYEAHGHGSVSQNHALDRRFFTHSPLPGTPEPVS